MNWQLQEAKNKLSKVVEAPRKSRPQAITVRGKEAAVVLSIEEYHRIAPKKESLADFFLRSPLRGSGIVIEREQDFDREVDL